MNALRIFLESSEDPKIVESAKNLDQIQPDAQRYMIQFYHLSQLEHAHFHSSRRGYVRRGALRAVPERRVEDISGGTLDRASEQVSLGGDSPGAVEVSSRPDIGQPESDRQDELVGRRI